MGKGGIELEDEISIGYHKHYRYLNIEISFQLLLMDQYSEIDNLCLHYVGTCTLAQSLV